MFPEKYNIWQDLLGMELRTQKYLKYIIEKISNIFPN